MHISAFFQANTKILKLTKQKKSQTPPDVSGWNLGFSIL